MDPVTGQIVRSETFRNLTLRPGVINSAVDVVNQGSQIATLSNAAAAPARPLATGHARNGTSRCSSHSPSGTGVMTLTVDPDGTGAHVPAVWNRHDHLPRLLRLTIRVCVRLSKLQSRAPLPIRVPGDTNQSACGTLAGRSDGAVDGEWNRQAFPYQYRVLLGGSGPNISPNATIAINDTALSNPIGLNGGTANVQQYSLGIGAFVAGAQHPNAGVGNDGSFTPGAAVTSALIGVPLNKTGLYALEDVDLFNILCLPLAARRQQPTIRR